MVSTKGTPNTAASDSTYYRQSKHSHIDQDSDSSVAGSSTCTPSFQRIRTPPSKKRTNRQGLPEECQHAILNTLLSSDNHQSFKYVCNSNRALFGESNSVHRKAVQNRRAFFANLQKNDPAEFLAVCVHYGLLSEEAPARKQNHSIEEELYLEHIKTPPIKPRPTVKMASRPSRHSFGGKYENSVCLNLVDCKVLTLHLLPPLFKQTTMLKSLLSTSSILNRTVPVSWRFALRTSLLIKRNSLMLW
jgi:hypothetical protein